MNYLISKLVKNHNKVYDLNEKAYHMFREIQICETARLQKYANYVDSNSQKDLLLFKQYTAKIDELLQTHVNMVLEIHKLEKSINYLISSCLVKITHFFGLTYNL